jgi:Mg-chelatase subunit ChlD
MQVLGVARTHVGATGIASRRDVNVILVLDRSGSLEAADACDDVESAATAFTSLFANQRDRMGMITFGGAYRLDYAMTKSFKQAPRLTDQIGVLDPGGCSGWTGSAQALWKGYEQLVALTNPAH